MTADKPSPCVPNLRFPEFRDAGEWEEKRIGDLKPFVTSGSRGWAAFYAPHGSLFVRIANLSRESIYLDLAAPKYVELPPDTSESSRTTLRFDDVLISITADIGMIGYVDADIPSPAYISQHIALVRFGAPKVYGKFVAYFLASERAQRQFRSTTDNGAKAGMSLMGVQAMSLLLPSPPEQQKIADCLGSMDGLIAAEDRKLEALQQHKQGLMQQLFPQPGETVPRLRFPEFVNTAWEAKAVGTLVSDTERPIVMDDETEYALVTVKRRYGGVVARKVLKGKAISVKSQFLIEANDFLISKRQIVHDACGLVPAELARSIVSNEYSVLTAKSGCDIDFFNYFTQQPCVSDSFLQSSVGIVIEKMLFKLDWWLKLEFPFPSFAEQQRIAACLSSLDVQLAAQVRKLAVLKTHKQGLLQQLFPALERQ